MQVINYNSNMQSRWDDFVRSSKNGTFLFLRGYMDYHADRFLDASIVVADNADRWLAVLPATRRDKLLASHGGLTYGGFITDARMTVPTMLEVFDAAAGYLVDTGIDEVQYKAIPHIYHRLPAEEDLYALFRMNAVLCRRDVASAIEPARPGPMQERRTRGARKARRASVEIRKCADQIGAFWVILEQTLTQKHGVKPVHRLDEFQVLAARFPEQIVLHAAFLGAQMVAGVVVYLTESVAHAQYIAASDTGRELGALDLLFQSLIYETYLGVRYFDFGISTEQGGRVLNTGLIEQKEGFGARAVTYDHYVWSLGTHNSTEICV